MKHTLLLEIILIVYWISVTCHFQELFSTNHFKLNMSYSFKISNNGRPFPWSIALWQPSFLYTLMHFHFVWPVLWWKHYVSTLKTLSPMLKVSFLLFTLAMNFLKSVDWTLHNNLVWFTGIACQCIFSHLEDEEQCCWIPVTSFSLSCSARKHCNLGHCYSQEHKLDAQKTNWKKFHFSSWQRSAES